MNTRHIDLLQLIQSYHTTLLRVSGTEGGEYHGPCPQCQGTDRLTVQPHYHYPRWACRRCHPHWSDAIEFVQWMDGVDFKAAVERLQLTLDTPMPHTPRPATSLTKRYPALTNGDWQMAASQFELDSISRLFSDTGATAKQYLQSRGITERVMLAASLGYNDTDRRTEWGELEVYLPRSITIPWTYEGRLWKMNMRKPKGTPKYICAKGSANGLYGASFVRPDCTVVMFEGELDALLFRAQLPDYVKQGTIPVATGSNTGARMTRWIALLSVTKRVLLAFDSDGAGDSAASYWQDKLQGKAMRLRPSGHDLGDMYAQGHDLEAWLLNGVSDHIERGA